MRKAQNRIWDFCWYAFITTVFVGSALYAAIADVHWHLFMRWFGFAFLTFFPLWLLPGSQSTAVEAAFLLVLDRISLLCALRCIRLLCVSRSELERKRVEPGVGYRRRSLGCF